MPFAGTDNTSVAEITDDPFVQVANYPSVRNMCKQRTWFSGRHNVMTMNVHPTEDHVYDAGGLRIVQSSNILSDVGGYRPGDIMWGQTLSGLGAANVVVKRRKFRWTRTWGRYVSGASTILILNDLKLAHGVQVNIKSFTYNMATFPYMSLHVQASFEFRGRHGAVSGGPQVNAQAWMFPYTNASIMGL